MPYCVNFSSLRYLHLQDNEFTGPIPNVISRSSSLVTLDVRDNKLSGGIPSWISSFSKLRILLLKGNNLEGSIPFQLCQLNSISIMDLSHNKLFGSIPSCLSNITFGRKCALDDTFGTREYGWTTYRSSRTYSHENQLELLQYVVADYYTSDEEAEAEFITKSRSESYKGNILYFMSGMDLSWNKLTGRAPERKAQFATFEENSYKGNSFLCGPPLERSCTITRVLPSLPPSSDYGELDSFKIIFFWSFGGSYVVAFLGVISFLYFNPYYRGLLFSFIEAHVPSFR
ncbi:hypothetical protein F0562_009399 [Nyssa sinensis]|uniref:Uncharacterized protein n=1 Tax=Nyssa sinensis TaxID=561372 RepID=A0A5J4ZYS1_9ASTE|nr:hypothetical protein F0562_009399 [Nyssa sinensis]